uniref:Cytochrome c oxidase subunit 2 n=1 Tax=Amicula sp. isolate GU52X-4 cfCalB7 TaxID=3003489 RepID=A0A9E9C5T9_9STRA|nr:cytochrome c oxidase subunit 2 [Amicula sp. isolate GU52X-4 cfCalB7]
MKNLFQLNYLNGDVAQASQMVFQDPASTAMEGIWIFNIHLLFIIIQIIIVVAWVLISLISSDLEIKQSENHKFSHSNIIEIVWTSVPALILLSLASPSFSLLYSFDELSNPELTLKILGHQWYWSYEISDFNIICQNNKILKCSSYMLTNESLKENIGTLRLLETNKRIALPSNTHIRLLITAVDVLHSWTIPSFGVKVDACPGRLNQANLFPKRLGIFYGQCSEICGANHGFMPIVITVLGAAQFFLLST